jgi:hypothetical protein
MPDNNGIPSRRPRTLRPVQRRHAAIRPASGGHGKPRSIGGRRSSQRRRRLHQHALQSCHSTLAARTRNPCRRAELPDMLRQTDRPQARRRNETCTARHVFHLRRQSLLSTHQAGELLSSRQHGAALGVSTVSHGGDQEWNGFFVHGNDDGPAFIQPRHPRRRRATVQKRP